MVSWEYPEKGFIINHMDREAFRRYSKRLGSALSPALKDSASGLFCDSWEVGTNRIWTKGFGEEFRNRYGYYISPYMDSIYSPAYSDARYDYMKLASEYVVEQFYIPFAEECRRLRAFSRVQCAGAPVDLIRAYASVDVPETEAMLYEPPYSRIVANGVNQVVWHGMPFNPAGIDTIMFYARVSPIQRWRFIFPWRTDGSPE